MVSTQQRNKIHPHKFTLWIAIGSIIMMFAGLTSAYIVKSGQAGWHEVKTPAVFWYSTGMLFLSSISIQAALRSFKHRSMAMFRTLMLVTLVLGMVFVFLQYIDKETTCSFQHVIILFEEINITGKHIVLPQVL